MFLSYQAGGKSGSKHMHFLLLYQTNVLDEVFSYKCMEGIVIYLVVLLGK